jgi:hypothetical protein
MDRRSWATQRIANRLPPWSDARVLPFSVLQQIINPMASEIEDLYQYVSDGNKNRALTTANLSLMDVAYVLRLPNDFEFGTDDTNIQNQTYIAPAAKVVIDGSDVFLEATSTIDDFWDNALPTRAVHGSTEKRIPVRVVLDEVALGDLFDEVPGEITHPTRLVVTVSGCETFVDLSRRTESSFLVFTGTTERGLEETELLVVPYNGVFLTKKIWKILTSVQSYGLQPETGIVSVDCFAFNKGREVDKYQIYVTPHAEKLMYHKLGSREFVEGTYSIHQQTTVTADTLGDLYSGNDVLEVVREVELLYEGNNITLRDMAIQPFTGRIFGLASDAIYIFDQYGNLPDCRGLGAKTAGASMVIETDKYDYIRGETATLRPYWRKPSKKIYRNRWSVQKPDGTVAYIDIEGTESSDASGAWITNLTYMELAFGPFESLAGDVDTQRFDYVLTQRGTYLFILETLFSDGTVEKDIVPLHTHYKEATKKLDLPLQLAEGDGIAFDADQRLWILRQTGDGDPYDLPYAYAQQYNMTGCAYEVRLATDTMLVDFKNKIIYLHEEYNSVDVTESEDWVVTQ